jgi:hypothetical protein
MTGSIARDSGREVVLFAPWACDDTYDLHDPTRQPSRLSLSLPPHNHARQVPTFYALLFLSVFPTHPTEAIVVASVYSALLAAMVPLWLWLECTDPAAAGGCACPCFSANRYWNSEACEWQPTSRRGRVAPDFEVKASTKVSNQRVVRYDAATKKRVKGLDHFCKWLNTPVGFRNYPHFFLLMVLCNVQMLLSLAISITALAAWGASAFVWAWVLWIVNACGCVVLLYFGFDLLFYHFYLLRRGISTYDDIFEKAQKKVAARKLAARGGGASGAGGGGNGGGGVGGGIVDGGGLGADADAQTSGSMHSAVSTSRSLCPPDLARLGCQSRAGWRCGLNARQRALRRHLACRLLVSPQYLCACAGTENGLATFSPRTWLLCVVILSSCVCRCPSRALPPRC